MPKISAAVFHAWLVDIRQQWSNFRAAEQSLISFEEYIAARTLYFQEKNNG